MADGANDKTEKLKRACDCAYVTCGSSCSHAVWYVISQYDSSQNWMQANDLVSHLSHSPKWKPVGLREVTALAGQGALIVGGLSKAPGHGHVIVIYPGPEKLSGGYNRKDHTGRMVKQPAKGSYPRAMSTSSGTWPGAKSHGDKTAWDAWGDDTEFKKVKFWKYVGDGAGVV